MTVPSSSPPPLTGSGGSRTASGLPQPAARVNIFRLLLKALLLFALFNLLLIPVSDTALGRPTLYNTLIPGRARFPFGENPQKSYNLSLYNLEAMFRSHEIAGAKKAAGEYRVILIGDSSVWGTLLRPEQTLSGQLNALGLTCGGKQVRVFNLGYPTISLAKDVMILRRALAYQPDLVIWPLTLEAFPWDKQLASPLAANNIDDMLSLERSFNLPLHVDESARPWGFDLTLIGRRRALADLFRLQLYGVMWAATGIDQEYPAKYTPAQVDFDADYSFHIWKPEPLPPLLPDQDWVGIFGPNDLAWNVLSAGIQIAGKTGVPVLLVNEPMLISTGKNSGIRYNFFYPRWAYNGWHAELTNRAAAQGWNLLDAWDLLPPAEFTNSAIHLTPAGEAAFAQQVAQRLCP